VKCAEAVSSVQAYVDGELTGVDREQIQRHIGTCEVCARSCLLQGRFKAAVRAHLPRPPVPADFRRRLHATLDAVAPEPPRHSWAWLRYSRMVPAFGAGVLLLLITLKVRETQSQVLGQAQRSYQAEMPMDVVGSDCGSIASWFRGLVDFPALMKEIAHEIEREGRRNLQFLFFGP